MRGPISYLNTDLDLHSIADLTPLATWLEASGGVVLACTPDRQGQWHASFETGEDFQTPEDTMIVLLDTLEGLSPALRDDWDRCITRKFNIGYAVGDTSLPFEQGITSAVLRRMSDMQIDLKVTLYSGDGTVERPQE